MRKFRVGLIGCGRISDIYLKNCATFELLEVAACASLDMEESRGKAAQYGIPKACTPDEIFADPSIEAVLNLTIPAAHYEISRRALEAGKQVTKLALEWEEHFSCLLDDELGIKRLRFSDRVLDEGAQVDSEDEAARFDADFTLMSLELRRFLVLLVEAFGGSEPESA